MAFNGHTGFVTALVDELRICSGSNDKTVKVWNSGNGVCERSLKEPTIISIALLVDGRICGVSIDGFVKIWNMNTGVCEHAISVVNSVLSKVVQLHDGRLVVSDLKKIVAIVGG
jgi:WD40 repeat protein